MLFDDTVIELFLRKFWSSEIFYPSETAMASAKQHFHQFPKVTSSKISHLILWKCYHVVHFPLSSFIMYIQKILDTVLMYVQDILTATRTFSWYMWRSWENSDDILTQSDGIFLKPRNPPKFYFTLKRQIKVPATQSTLNTHITQKMDLATCTIFFSMVPFIHGKCW